MNRKAIWRPLALSLCLVQLLQARDVNPVLLSTYLPPSGGITTDVAVSGSLVYVCEGEKGLTILDISNPSVPQFVGAVDTPGFASSVVVTNNLAFVADGTAGLTLADVSNPAAPAIVGAYNTQGNCAGVVVAGNFAYLADGDYGLQIIDCSNPSQPIRLAGYNTFGTALSVAISGAYAYVADGDNGLVVIDASNPAAPRKIAGYTGLAATHVVVAGSYAYVSSDGTLVIFDVSNPLTPEPISSVALPGIVTGSSISGTTAYIASGIGGFYVLDTTDRFAPSVLGTTSLLTNAVRVAGAGPLAFAADLTNGLRVIAAENPAVIDVITHIPTRARDFAISGNYLYAVNGQLMEIVEISKIDDMRVVGQYRAFLHANWDGASRVVLFDSYALIVDTTTFSSGARYEIVSVSDPTNPRMVLSGSLSNRPQDLKAAGPYLLITGAGFIIDQMTSNGLQQVGIFTNEIFAPYALAVKGTAAWAAGLRISSFGSFQPYLYRFDVSNPSNPTAVNSVRYYTDYQMSMSVAETNGFLLLTSDPSVRKEQILRVFDLDSLADVAAASLIGVKAMAVATNNIYLAKGVNGVAVMRLEGNSIVSVGGAGLPDATAIATTSNYVFVAAGTNGLYAMTHFQPSTRLEMSTNTNRTQLLKAFGPIGSSGRIQRATDFHTNSFQDWQSVQLNSYPQIFTDTNSPRAFYRFVSP